MPEVHLSLIDKFRYYWGKIALILLMLHSLYGLGEAVMFLFVEYPELDRLLNAHLLTASKVADVTINGLIVLGVTTISILMTLRLHSMRERIAHNYDLILASIIIIFTPFAKRWLSELPWETWIQSLF